MIDFAEEIKERITCQEFADFVGLKVNRSGFTVCPFHADKDASLRIYKGNRGWCCFGCHKGGDVINLASLYYGLTFKDTLKRLDEDFNLGLYQESNLTPESRVLRAVEVARRRTARGKKERILKALQSKYWIAFDKWLEADRRFEDEAPKSANEEFSQAFVRAAREKLERLEDLKDIEMELLNYGKV